MRTCRSILAIILAFSFVSCQSAPQSPVRPEAQPKTFPETQAPMAPEYLPPPHIRRDCSPVSASGKVRGFSIYLIQNPAAQKGLSDKTRDRPCRIGPIKPPKPGSRYRGGCPCVE